MRRMPIFRGAENAGWAMTTDTDRIFAQEPEIAVGIMEEVRGVTGRFNGLFQLGDGRIFTGPFAVQAGADGVIFADSPGARIDRQAEMCFRAQTGASYTLDDVTIGARFHWERKQQQTFRGDLLLLNHPGGGLMVVNRLGLEDYLTSVISSEMNAAAPLEMLKAHAIASRSWLMAMLRRRGEKTDRAMDRREAFGPAGEIVRWYGREDHARFDVCADDHCQRYQGITKIVSDQAVQAVRSTRGIFLVHDRMICDARYHKACGGRTENFENTWEDTPVPYLSSITDADVPLDPVAAEAAAEKWVRMRPDAYCNMMDKAFLRRVLPTFDQETTDFFRWQVSYRREELEEILREKSGMDFGSLQCLIPVARGPSGRIMRLRIEGSKATITVGKELEIRRWLSPSHLYSSAFCVSVQRDASSRPARFILHGAGWGHGVGMCQIGAAVMTERGHKAEAVLMHYFQGAELKKLYE